MHVKLTIHLSVSYSAVENTHLLYCLDNLLVRLRISLAEEQTEEEYSSHEKQARNKGWIQ